MQTTVQQISIRLDVPAGIRPDIKDAAWANELVMVRYNRLWVYQRSDFSCCLSGCILAREYLASVGLVPGIQSKGDLFKTHRRAPKGSWLPTNILIVLVCVAA